MSSSADAIESTDSETKTLTFTLVEAIRQNYQVFGPLKVTMGSSMIAPVINDCCNYEPFCLTHSNSTTTSNLHFLGFHSTASLH